MEEFDDIEAFDENDLQPWEYVTGEDEEFCDHEWGEPEKVSEEIWRCKCKKCGFEQEEALFQQFWPRKTIKIKGKAYRALKRWGNISQCVECGKVIFDVPLILWDKKDPSKAVSFCWKCVEKLELIKGLAST